MNRYDSKAITRYLKTGVLKPSEPSYYEVMHYSDTSFKFWCKNNMSSTTNFSRNEKLKIKQRLQNIKGTYSNYEIQWLNMR